MRPLTYKETAEITCADCNGVTIVAVVSDERAFPYVDRYGVECCPKCGTKRQPKSHRSYLCAASLRGEQVLELDSDDLFHIELVDASEELLPTLDWTELKRIDPLW